MRTVGFVNPSVVVLYYLEGDFVHLRWLLTLLRLAPKELGCFPNLRLEPPTDAQRGFGCVQVLIGVADESIEVVIASLYINIDIVAHIVFDADARIGSEAVAIGENDGTAVGHSGDGGIQMG